MIDGAFYNLKSKKTPFIMCAGLFGHLPYEIPTFQATSPNLITHSISPLNTNSLQNKPSLLKGIFSLNPCKLSIPYSLHSSYISLLTYHPLSQTKILATKQKRDIRLILGLIQLSFAILNTNTLNPYKTTLYGFKMAPGGTLRYNIFS